MVYVCVGRRRDELCSVSQVRAYTGQLSLPTTVASLE